MDSYLELSVLYDYYGALLTETQQSICDMYYNQNLSLTEIAEDLGITKQGVRDALKKSEKLLFKFENSLQIKSKNEQIGVLVKQLEQSLSVSDIDLKKKSEIFKLAEEINSLI